jgi:hypothetical protein
MSGFRGHRLEDGYRSTLLTDAVEKGFRGVAVSAQARKGFSDTISGARMILKTHQVEN